MEKQKKSMKTMILRSGTSNECIDLSLRIDKFFFDELR